MNPDAAFAIAGALCALGAALGFRAGIRLVRRARVLEEMDRCAARAKWRASMRLGGGYAALAVKYSDVDYRSTRPPDMRELDADITRARQRIASQVAASSKPMPQDPRVVSYAAQAAGLLDDGK